jgi:hypothetical protein
MCSADHSKITPFRIALNNVMSKMTVFCSEDHTTYMVLEEGDSGVPHTFEGQGNKIRLRQVCPG